jgi:hypothetical protein
LDLGWHGMAWHGIIGVEGDSTPMDSSTNTSHFPIPFQLNELVTWRGAIQGGETKVFESKQFLQDLL